MREYYVYILASKKNGTLYVGMAGDLKSRVRRRKSKNASKFTRDYKINKLVYFEQFKDKKTAWARERQLKKYNRRWKIRLIEQLNPTWQDLFSKVTNTNILGPRQKT